MNGEIGATAVPIAVIGMACRFPGADTVERFWANLVGEVESITRDGDGEPHAEASDVARYVSAVGRIDGVEWFDADYFRVPPAEAVIMDPQQRVLLEVAVAALEDAGYAGANDAVVGVFAGSGENHYYRDFIAPSPEFEERLGDTRITLANEKDFLAPRIAFKLGLRGPSITIQSGCSTSLTAVALACQSLSAGDCDIALAGGVTVLMPGTDGYTYSEGGILSADGRCRAFDRRASGTLPSSGAGMVVLKRDDAAQADRDNRRAVIRGWALNNDGGSRAGFTAPNVEGQTRVVRAALARAGVRPRDVSYVEAHGTATEIGDPIEIEALRRAFADDDCPSRSCAIGSVKTNIGHTDAAAGVAALIKTTLAVEAGVIPASLNFEEPNPEIDFGATPFFVADATRPWPRPTAARIAGVSSFGLGGMNAHAVLENAPPVEPSARARPKQLLVLSARTAEALEAAKARLAEWLDERRSLSPGAFADVAYTLAAGRPQFQYRWAGSFDSPAEAVAALREPAAPSEPTARQVLVVRGAPHELVAMTARALADDPLVRETFATLAGAGLPGREAAADASLLGRVAVETGAALGVTTTVLALRTLGASFARIDAPAWLAPAMRWVERRGPLEDLPEALAASTGGNHGARSNEGEVPAGGSRSVVVDPAFDLPAAVAQLWSLGTAIDWQSYYADEARRRTSLPTYPFTRQRFWLDKVRVERPAETATSNGRGDAAEDTERSVSDVVQAVWCETLGRDSIAPSAHFVDDLDGDSMYAAEIGARLNELLDVELPIDLPFVAPTIAETVRYIEEARVAEVAS